MSHETLGRALAEIWQDQAAFNAQLRTKPVIGSPEYAEQLREFVLNLTDELHELLRVSVWKKHRRKSVPFNAGQADNEIADAFKMWLTIAQLHGWTPEQMIEEYKRKTAVVKQRHREEWLANLEGPIAVVDIDNVLCDYGGGLLRWMKDFGYLSAREYADLSARPRFFINAESLGIPESRWTELKHRFRSHGGKRGLPAMPDARKFLEQLQTWGLKIVLLTARPIDRWPNIYTDTIAWLQAWSLPFDLIWWTVDNSKMARLFQDDVVKRIVFAVDDDPRYGNEYAKHGIRTYLVNVPDGVTVVNPAIEVVRDLSHLAAIEGVHHVEQRASELRG